MLPERQQSNWHKHDRIPTLVPWRTPLTPALRTKFFLTGVIFPVSCFLAVAVLDFSPVIDEPWQSGEPSQYLNLLMSRPSFLIFLPILAYSVCCMGLWCVKPQTSKYFLVRFGLYTGIVLSAMFMCMLSATTVFFGQVFAVIVGLGLAFSAWIIGKVVPRIRRFTIMHLLILTTVTAILLVVLRIIEVGFERNLSLLVFVGIMIVGAAPTLAFITFSRVSRAAWFMKSVEDNQTTSLARIIATMVWLIGFCATWRLALASMMDEYSKLPINDPNCFVSSAAAQGHCTFVKSVPTSDGETVNLQMRRLKFLEFALAASFPTAHRAIRLIYNRVGPALARVCRQNCWLADIAYLALKPLEGMAVLVQRHSVTPDNRIQAIYTRRQHL